MPDRGVAQPGPDGDRDRFAYTNAHADAGRHGNARALIHADDRRPTHPDIHGCANRHACIHRGPPADRIARPFVDGNPTTFTDPNSSRPLVCSRRRIRCAAH